MFLRTLSVITVLLIATSPYAAEDEPADPTKVLAREHALISKVAEKCRQIAVAMRPGGNIDRPGIQKIHDFFANFADTCHHAKEETAFFPVLRTLNMDETTLDLLIKQHEGGRILLAGVKEQLQADAIDNHVLAHYLDAYGQLMQRHIDIENNYLWPKAQDTLSGKQKKSASRAFHKIETEELGKGFHDKYHAMAMDILKRFAAK